MVRTRESNPRPPAQQSSALLTELILLSTVRDVFCWSHHRLSSPVLKVFFQIQLKGLRKTCIFSFQYDANFMKKIPPGAEASNVLVGELDFLKKPVTAFVRLENAHILGDLTEVPVPTRFIFIMLGPPGTPGRYHEVGRAIATLMSDEVCSTPVFFKRNFVAFIA